MDRPILGKAEKVDFPQFNLQQISAKVDTGAYTSSIDCERVQEVEQDGKKVLKFVLLRPGKTGYSGEEHYTQDYIYAEIKSANGVQMRYIIETDVAVAGKTFKMRFSLSDRSRLLYPVLIGRKLIAEGNYLVDVKVGEGPTDDEEARGL